MLKTLQITIICLVVAVASGTIGYLINWGMTRVEVSTANSERDKAILEKATMQKQWEIAVNELNQTKVLLKDTLAAIEVLRQYQIIDKDIKDDLAKIDNTLDTSGQPTEETYDEFRKMIEEFNRQQGWVTNSQIITYAVLDQTPFLEVKTNAEAVLKGAIELVLKFKEK